MRNAFIDELYQLAKKDPQINLVVGDLGYSVVEKFAEEMPAQFLNAGVAEQTMTGLAAGMALHGGRKVFTYSIGNFSTLRCLEQIRNDVCYHGANVKVIAVGGGLAYGSQGYTHYAVEDLAIMRTLPRMVVCAPTDPAEARVVARLAAADKSPWYIRLGKNGEPSLHDHAPDDLTVGKAIRRRDGDHGTVIVTGSLAGEALAAVDALAAENLSLRLLFVPFVKPIDSEEIRKANQETGWLLTIEEHTGFGGLFAAVSEALSGTAARKAIHRRHLPETFDTLGSQEYLRQRYGLDRGGIAATIRKIVTG